MSTATTSNLFMFSPLSKYAGFYQELLSGTVNNVQLANCLIQEGERAHTLRQFDRLREVGLILSNVPLNRCQAIGSYFLALASGSGGNGDQEKAKRLFEFVVDRGPDSYKVKALVSLGTLAIRGGDLDSAFCFFRETIGAQRLDAMTLQAVRGVSILKSIEGSHKSALADLEGILPLVRFAPLKAQLDCLNSYAVELSEVSRLQEAENIATLVNTSPLAAFYPEWRETLSDVKSKRKRRSTVSITRPTSESEIEEQDEPRPEPEISENAFLAARVQTVIDFMNSNLSRRISLPELSRQANISGSHLHRLFILKTGRSPGDYLIKLRMEKAGHLLTTSFLSIKEVMAAVGYRASSRGNFLRQFKDYFKVTPSEYRKHSFNRA